MSENDNPDGPLVIEVRYQDAHLALPAPVTAPRRPTFWEIQEMKAKLKYAMLDHQDKERFDHERKH